MEFSNRIKELRQEKEIRHADVAEFLGITRRAYSYYETGEREPNFETLAKLARFFDVTSDYLIGLTDDI